MIHNSLKIRCYYLATLSHGDPILNHMIYTNFLIERKINKSLHPKYFFKKLILYNYIQCYLIKIMPKLLYFKNLNWLKCYEIKKKSAAQLTPLQKTPITLQPLKLPCWKFICKWFLTPWTTLLKLPEVIYFDQSV